jgi:hypothetical protein
MYIYDNMSLNFSSNEMFQTQVVEKIKTFYYQYFFFSKIAPFMRYCRHSQTHEGQDGNIMQCLRFACRMTKTRAQTHADASGRAARFEAWVCGRSRAGLWVRIPPGHGCLSLLSVVCCQVEVPASGWSLVQSSPTECGVSV